MPIFINSLGCEGLRLIQTLNDSEKEKCKTSTGLFEVLSEKFKPQHNETILYLYTVNLKGKKRKILKNGWVA